MKRSQIKNPDDLEKFLDQFTLKQLVDSCSTANKGYMLLYKFCKLPLTWEIILRNKYNIILDDNYHKAIAKKIFMDIYSDFPDPDAVDVQTRNEVYANLNQELILQPLQEHIESYYPSFQRGPYNYVDPGATLSYDISSQYQIRMFKTVDNNIGFQVVIDYYDPETELHVPFEKIYFEFEVDTDQNMNPFTIFDYLIEFLDDHPLNKIQHDDVVSWLAMIDAINPQIEFTDQELETYLQQMEYGFEQPKKTQ